jgi:hypothetical protein
MSVVGESFHACYPTREDFPTRSDSGRLVQTTTMRGGSCWASTKPPDYFGFVRTELML